ncbi:uncharacterized protein OCT59_009336 [Rhizophagus irregularis]|uniref:uncharacterized protein n=1 Tax=Rhizophagus irregularis TaxID=588596 RepID=UPI0033281029|nr:hypothetical protein OCT59_009336 [Rhizophagus irregularis]
MSAVVLSHDAAKYSIHEYENFFWKFRMMNIYDVVALDLAKFTGVEMRDVMKIIIFVLDELYTNNDIIRHRNDTENTLHEFVDYWGPYVMLNKELAWSSLTFRKEKFNEDELNEFKQEIIRWSDNFVKLFKTFSRSELRLPKFHIWRYHTIQTIKRYGAINGLTTETYKTLHKNWVKNPYRISNKKNVLDQIIKTIRRQIIITNELKKPTMLKLDYAFLDEKSNILENDNINLKIYASGILTNGEIVYATSRFYGRPKFSDIAIAMDDADYLTDNGICYGKILMLAEIILSSSTLPIALIHWYDYYSKRYPKKYECPHLKFVNSYDVVPFNSIVGLVHIVKRFNYQNEFFDSLIILGISKDPNTKKLTDDETDKIDIEGIDIDTSEKLASDPNALEKFLALPPVPLKPDCLKVKPAPIINEDPIPEESPAPIESDTDEIIDSFLDCYLSNEKSDQENEPPAEEPALEADDDYESTTS